MLKVVTPLLLLACVGCASITAVETNPEIPLVDKNIAPAANMPLIKADQSGDNLADYLGNGKWTLVMFWDSNCGYSTFEELSVFHNRYRNNNAEVLGVSIEGKEKLAEFKQHLKTKKPTFPNLIGELTVVASRYSTLAEEPLKGTPSFLLFRPNGEMAAQQAGTVVISELEKFIADNS